MLFSIDRISFVLYHAHTATVLLKYQIATSIPQKKEKKNLDQKNPEYFDDALVDRNDA